MDNRLDEVMNEIRSTNAKLEADRQALVEERAAFEKEKAAAQAPATRSNENELSLREVANAMIEKRAITLNGSGNVKVMQELAKVISEKTDILKGARYFYGPSSNTVIPVLNPRPASPSRAAEGASSIASDSTAALGACSIMPETYVSVLPVSFETIKYSAAGLEAQLPEIFANAFAQAMANGMVAGRGAATYYEMDGIFTHVPSGNKIACAASGAPTLADLVTLAIKMRTYDMVNPVIVISPTLYAGITTATVSGYDAYKNELIMNKTIEGCKVIISSKAPTAVTANSIVAVGLDLNNYAIGVAADLTIEPLKKPGDTNTYYQAVMGFNGKPICADSIFGLKAVSST